MCKRTNVIGGHVSYRVLETEKNLEKLIFKSNRRNQLSGLTIGLRNAVNGGLRIRKARSKPEIGAR